MKNKDMLPLYIIEYCWLIIGLCALFVCIQEFSYNRFNTDVAIYFIVAALSGAMFVYRRKKRKKLMQES
ncbi:MAG: hypothetical protein LBR55_04530 [Bacteroidales bacterium]|jgi:cell division protein FtsW (lipid II flippase)|nr:hypothetical protein [Bacteroidales bacterium]